MSAPSHHASLDAIVSLKVFFDGSSTRAKLPLRDMVPRTLEKHVRTILQLPDDSKIMIERFSDSAGAHVLLDSANASVYKQLYRAAKAKSKLRLRVSIIDEEKPASAPATPDEEAQTSEVPADSAPAAKSEASASTVKSTTPPLTATAPVESTAVKLALRGFAPSITRTAATVKEPAKDTYRPCDWTEEFQSSLKDFKQATGDLADLASQLEWQLPATSIEKTLSDMDSATKSSDDVKSPEIVNSKTAPPRAARPCRAAAPNKPVPSWPAGSNDSAYSNPAKGCGFAVCCNHCESNIPNAHYHCSTCDDGDFDLCQSCVDLGFTCHSNDHWLIKRSMKNGQLVNSTTETIAPKPKPKPKPLDKLESKQAFTIARNYSPDVLELPLTSHLAAARYSCFNNMRTCNCCVQELPEREFLHCKTCEDFDLCRTCFANDTHGHHPKHAFAPAIPGAHMPDHIKAKMRPGRNQMHHAICDGCDKYIMGVRHKCLDCPDWDYCSECVLVAHLTHANHRFAPIYEPLGNTQACVSAQPIHIGICCDGPLCSASQAFPSYIRGVRYKCAVCHDLDFCANCEAHPGTNHNKTHPLIKFKTPVRHVSVTTTGEHPDGKRMPAMGDRMSTKSAEVSSPSEKNTLNAVATVAETKPQESRPEVKIEAAIKETASTTEVHKGKAPAAALEQSSEELRAVFVRDTVLDGTILPPNQVFEQTWVLRNDGTTAWPAGCSVKFVGGDYMGHVDSAHPAGISELVSASESTVCYAPLAPGQDFSFTVLLRTPVRSGKIISYWRLTTDDGHKFGHRLWCEVNVRPAAEETKPELDVLHVEDVKKEQESSLESSSTMIFPKLEKESPSASMHEEAQNDVGAASSSDKVASEDGFEDFGDDDWEPSEMGFMTDDEYDILDASDEEFLEEQQKTKLARK